MAEESKQEFEKPLDKMTVKELREIALEIPQITGVHGMNKQDLLVAIKEAKGITEETKKQASSSIRQLKAKINELKAKRQQALESNDRKMATIYRRRISRLKKKTRRAA